MEVQAVSDLHIRQSTPARPELAPFSHPFVTGVSQLCCCLGLAMNPRQVTSLLELAQVAGKSAKLHTVVLRDVEHLASRI